MRKYQDNNMKWGCFIFEFWNGILLVDGKAV